MPGFTFEAGQVGLQKCLFDFTGLTRVKKLATSFKKRKFADMTLKELRYSNVRVSDWSSTTLDFRQKLYAISDSEFLLRALLVGIAMEMELRGYVREEVDGLSALKMWWGDLYDRKLDMRAVQREKSYALDPFKEDAAAILGEGNFLEKTLAKKFSIPAAEFGYCDILDAEMIERSRLAMVHEFNGREKHLLFLREDKIRQGRVRELLAKERRMGK